MDRESSKHGPHLDQEMARETEDLVRSGHAAHTEEWRQPEPVGELRQPRMMPGGPGSEDIETRSMLARTLGPGLFPAGRDTVLAQARAADLPDRLTEAIAALPAGQTFANIGGLARALGITTES